MTDEDDPAGIDQAQHGLLVLATFSEILEHLDDPPFERGAELSASDDAECEFMFHSGDLGLIAFLLQLLAADRDGLSLGEGGETLELAGGLVAEESPTLDLEFLQGVLELEEDLVAPDGIPLLDGTSAHDAHDGEGEGEVAGTSGVVGVSALSGLLGAQEVEEDGERASRRQMAQRGADILDKLEEIRRDILAGAVPTILNPWGIPRGPKT
jgi:hypothetical protein